jgi:Aminotransferase class-III
MVFNDSSTINGGIPASVLAAYGASDNKANKGASTDNSALLYRNIHSPPRQVVASAGNYLTLGNGQQILDATCGAAVSCLGHGNERVKEAIVKQLDQVAYCLSIEFGTGAAEDLATELKNGTNGLMKKAYIVNSGKTFLAVDLSDEDRIGCNGCRNEACSPVLSRSLAFSTAAYKVHCQGTIISWNYTWLSSCRWAQGPSCLI